MNDTLVNGVVIKLKDVPPLFNAKQWLILLHIFDMIIVTVQQKMTNFLKDSFIIEMVGKWNKIAEN